VAPEEKIKVQNKIVEGIDLKTSLQLGSILLTKVKYKFFF
jgi:hypothetical protein